MMYDSIKPQRPGRIDVKANTVKRDEYETIASHVETALSVMQEKGLRPKTNNGDVQPYDVAATVASYDAPARRVYVAADPASTLDWNPIQVVSSTPRRPRNHAETHFEVYGQPQLGSVRHWDGDPYENAENKEMIGKHVWANIQDDVDIARRLNLGE